MYIKILAITSIYIKLTTIGGSPEMYMQFLKLDVLNPISPYLIKFSVSFAIRILSFVHQGTYSISKSNMLDTHETGHLYNI